MMRCFDSSYRQLGHIELLDMLTITLVFGLTDPIQPFELNSFGKLLVKTFKIRLYTYLSNCVLDLKCASRNGEG